MALAILHALDDPQISLAVLAVGGLWAAAMVAAMTVHDFAPRKRRQRR